MIVRERPLSVHHQWQNEHVIAIWYGIGDCWKEVSDRFWQIYASHYDIDLNSSTLTINNRCFEIGDHSSGNQLVIETMEGGEYIFMEGREVTF